MLENIALGFGQLLHPSLFIALFIGVLVGLIVGALPGLNDSITMAVLIPVTFGMEPKIAMVVLVGIYVSACYGGSIPAILLNIPGTASSVVTCIDGYKMTQKGESGLALGISTTSSVFGGLMSSLVLMFLAPFLAIQALRFGPPEYFSLAIMGISTVVGMAGKNLLKSLLVGVLGLVISTIGMSPQVGFPRFCFGIDYLYDGIPLIPMLIGLFGVTSVLELSDTIKNDLFSKAKVNISKIGRMLPDGKMLKRLLPVWITSGAIGNIIGIIPGAGMIMAIYMAYDQAKRRNKDKEFGTGIPEGVAAPETANNAVVASSMVPLLSLGVPGNSTSALFIGALMIQGMRPGPSLFKDYPDIAYLIIAGFFVGNLLMGPMGLALGKFMSASILRLNRYLLNGVVVLLCVTGAFSVRNSVFDIWIMIIFGVISYIFNRLRFSLSSIILPLILGPMMEQNLQQSLILSKGSWSIFFTSPISLGLLIISAFFLAAPIWGIMKEKLRDRKASI
jgi:putative tricarboxylic transport membrane protein